MKYDVEGRETLILKQFDPYFMYGLNAGCILLNSDERQMYKLKVMDLNGVNIL
jgi:hypothetical protein